MSGELKKNGRALAGRRMARACAEILGEHLHDERARKLVWETAKARVMVESMEPIRRGKRRLMKVDMEVFA